MAIDRALQTLFVFALLLATGSRSAFAVEPSSEEAASAAAWTKAAFAEEAPGQVPFSFSYAAKPSSEFLAQCAVERGGGENGERATTYRDPATGLAVRCVVTKYHDFPAVEWVLYFKNEGQTDTPIVENIRAIDAGFSMGRDKTALLGHANGSDCRFDDFAPHVTPLGPNPNNPQGPWRDAGNPIRLESRGGRSSCGALPFFNLDMGGRGVMIAIGWTGDWAAAFHQSDAEAHVSAGMARTHFKLLPGEEVRSPRMLLLFWNGDAMRGHNLLRKFILEHHTPTVNGQPARAPIANATWGGNFADAHIAHGKWWKDNNLPMDYLWVDAGWFGVDEAKVGANVFNSQWGRLVGDWIPNPGYFPQGLKPVGDALAEMGLGFLLWLEPERVFRDTTWTREHPEFLLGPIGDNFLLDLGNPAARRMLTDHLANLIAEGRIGCYRQDFNMDPRPFWDAADASDRVGIAEIKHITGLYAMWDELRERFPGLLIDNCSSGGRRIDLETVSRSMPLWRSDFQCFPNSNIVTGMQNQTHGLGLWVPLSIGGCDREDTYAFRSALGPGIILMMAEFEKDVANHFNIEWLRKNLGELEQVRDCFLGDFHPLVEYSLADDVWTVWQFDRPDRGEGIVLAFRRPLSPFTSIAAKLRGLDPAAQYEIRDLDGGQVQQGPGAQWAESGLRIEMDSAPDSRLFTYRKRQP